MVGTFLAALQLEIAMAAIREHSYLELEQLAGVAAKG
jgi:hypothetical protein